MALAKANNIEAIKHSADDLQSGVIAGFSNGVQAVAENSASPAAAGTMPQGITFMSKEREGRELLVRYLSAVLDGLEGYQNVVTGVYNHYSHLSGYTAQQMTALLKPSGPVPVNHIFDWEKAVLHQLQNQPSAGGPR